MSGHTLVDHAVLTKHAEEKVNVEREAAKRRRTQVAHLRTRLEAHIAAHPDYDLVKMRGSGSTAKHTAIRARAGSGSDADVAAYVRAASVGGVDAEESGLLVWLKDRCVEVYGNTKIADDFTISEHAVGIVMHGSRLKIDVAPVLYDGQPDDQGFLITRQGDRVLTSVTLHLRFFNDRKRDAGRGYAELIRLLKAWIREAKRLDEDLRCKSFLLELLVAHLWSTGRHGEPLAVGDYPRAFEQILGYIAHTKLSEPIWFDDFHTADELVHSDDPIRIWDPVNPENNVARSYTGADRDRLVDRAGEALEEISWAAVAPSRAAANQAWKTLLGPSFEGA